MRYDDEKAIHEFKVKSLNQTIADEENMLKMRQNYFTNELKCTKDSIETLTNYYLSSNKQKEEIYDEVDER